MKPTPAQIQRFIFARRVTLAIALTAALRAISQAQPKPDWEQGKGKLVINHPLPPGSGKSYRSRNKRSKGAI